MCFTKNGSYKPDIIFEKRSKLNYKYNFPTILSVLVGMHSPKHSVATSAVVFWTDVGEIMQWRGYSHLSESKAPIFPTILRLQSLRQVFWRVCYCYVPIWEIRCAHEEMKMLTESLLILYRISVYTSERRVIARSAYWQSAALASA